MQPNPVRPIFREAALRRYQGRSESTALPRELGPRRFGLLWLLIAGLLAGAIAVWLPVAHLLTPFAGE
jgi:hypothetical protein